MLLDLVIAAIILLNVLLGLKHGLLEMLGRLVILILIVAVTLLLLGPLTDLLVTLPFLAPLADKLGGPVLKPLQDSAANIGAAIESFGLPKILADLMQSQLPTPDNSVTQAYPEFTAVLFKFALNAAVFLVMFIIISIIIRLLARTLTRTADKLPLIGTANHLGGLLAGLAVGLVQCSLLLLFLGFVAPYISALADLVAGSWIAGKFYEINILSFIL
jgi:hypothetical protein